MTTASGIFILTPAFNCLQLWRRRVFKCDEQASGGACSKCSVLESELRKCKRAQEKMTAIQFRLRNDVEKAGGDLG